MNLTDLKRILEDFHPGVALDSLISHQSLSLLKKVSIYLVIAGFILTSGLFFTPTVSVSGFFLVILSIAITFICLDAMFYSYFFKEGVFGIKYPFLLSRLVYKLEKSEDKTKVFLRSYFGQRVLDRMGIEPDAVEHLFSHRSQKQGILEIKKDDIERSLLASLVKSDKDFETFLLSHGASIDTFVRTCVWVWESEFNSINREKWWGEDNLSQIKSIGSEWSFGKAYTIDRLSSPLKITLSSTSNFHSAEAETLANILLKTKESNALLIGEEGAGKIEVIENLVLKLRKENSTSSLKNKKFSVLHTSELISSGHEKSWFEVGVTKIFNEAEHAGNIVLIIPDFADLISYGDSIGVDIVTLLNPFFASSHIQIIAVSNIADFHEHLEGRAELIQRFDVLQVKDASRDEVLDLLDDRLISLEAKSRLFFTYPAVMAAVESANRFFVGSPFYDTAEDILLESGNHAASLGRAYVLVEDVREVVESRTGVPQSALKEHDRKLLQNLEKHLHEKIVAQDEAVKSIADALKRARAGISNPNRPLGSFLFLGPTGVGKTETTKALAEIFFGNKAKILRLDMSEYNSEDALNRLIGGSFHKTGVLSDLLRENQYGVLLLDEFEKTHPKVLDLFLQILDEGIFSDAHGRKVSARNLIIVATSNAGSNLIFDLVKRGENIENRKEEIIENIISSDIYKPELINRFDGVILFHPLNKNHLESIAKLELNKLQFRMKDRGINLVINNDLISFLSEKGSDPKFGARPLRRAIQDYVEKAIAERMINGNLPPGSSIELKRSDLN